MSNISLDLSTDDKNNFYLSMMRNERNKLLLESDKYLLSDFPISSNNLVLIKEYRNLLRDYMNIEITYDNSSNIIIPSFPDFPIF